MLVIIIIVINVFVKPSVFAGCVGGHDSRSRAGLYPEAWLRWAECRAEELSLFIDTHSHLVTNC